VDVVGTLRIVIWRGFLAHPGLICHLGPLLKRIRNAYMRFQVLMALFAAGKLRTRRRGPHTGGFFPHPENLLRGNPFPFRWLVANLGNDFLGCSVELEEMLAEPMAREILAKVPAAERALRPIRNLLGDGPNDPVPRRYERTQRLAREAYANVGIAEPAPRGVAKKFGRPLPPDPPPPTRRERLEQLIAWYRETHPPDKPP
jgi:hypothetical protein